LKLVPQSLKGRLLASLLVPLVGIGVLAALNSAQEAEDIARSVADRVLAGSALSIAERIVVTQDGVLSVEIPYAALEMLTSAAQDKVFYRVDGPPGEVITGYSDLPTVALDSDQELQFVDGVYKGDVIRLAILQRAASSGIAAIPFQVVVAETTLARQQLASSILVNSTLRLSLLIIAAVAIALVSVGFSIRPLYRLSTSISRRSPSELGPIVQRVPSEVRTLVDTINSFMGRLGVLLDGLRSFTGNASHQLRTPLTVVRTQLAFAMRAKTLEQAHAAAAEADESAVRIERVLAQLMVLARIDEVSSNHASALPTIDLVDVARTYTAEAIPDAAQVGIDLGFEDHEPVMVRADAIMVGELLHNLIDNAIKYAGAEANVTVRVFSGNKKAVLEVEDSGPGISPEAHENIRKRFHRGRADQPGSGLGIAIVDEIAALYDGKLTLRSGKGDRGLLATITLPMAAAGGGAAPIQSSRSSASQLAAETAP
jgi:two-component system sensor histidine kinase TctE